VHEGGRVLAGGRPLRVLSLAAPAAAALDRWRAGHPVSDDRTERLVGRRLVGAGLAHSVPVGERHVPEDVTVVVPTRDRATEVARLAGALAGMRVVVVDDGSRGPSAVARVAARAGADLVVLDHNVGPAGARNAGLLRVTTSLVAFVDSDCRPETGWLGPVLGHFDDPMVAAVAPRVVPEPVAGAMGRYERARSPLDRGREGGLVGPRAAIPFVPAAALVVRAELARAMAFDEGLRTGEDVDLVWRLAEAGWWVRYEPEARVRHTVRGTWAAGAAQRFGYGRSAGPLAVRHPGALVPARLTGAHLVLVALAFAARPRSATGHAETADAPWALGAAGWLTGTVAVSVAAWLTATVAVARRLRGRVGHPARLAVVMSGRAVVPGLLGALGGLARAWGPALAVLAAFRSTRRLAATVLLAPAIADWVAAPPGTGGPVTYVVAHVADDVAYGLGVWVGCAEARTVAPLVPLVAWSLRQGERGTPSPEAPGGAVT
jgi:mycofactocin system glycosyltransferase